MKNKQLILAFLLLLIGFKSYSQINYAKDNDFKDFAKTKTMVVLETDMFSIFNGVLKQAIADYWKITEYEIISPDQFKKMKSNRSYSFIVYSEAELDYKGSKYKYNMLNLVLGGKAKDLNEMPDLGSVPLTFTGDDEDNYYYKIGGVLQFMQFWINYNRTHANIKFTDITKINTVNIKSKELWLLPEDLADNVNTIQKIKQYYQGEVKMVSTEDIENAFKQRLDNVVILHKVGPGNKATKGVCWKFLISAKDGMPLYFDQHKINTNNPDAFLSTDFEKINK